MATTRIQHEFDCSEASFWQFCFLDTEYNRKLYLETLRFPVWRVIEQKTSDATVERRVEIRPLIENVPAPIKRVLGDRFGYIEEGKLDRTKNRYRFRIVPSSLADKTRISGATYT